MTEPLPFGDIMLEKSQKRKLTESDIPIIRERIASGDRYRVIGADYDVSAVTISNIKRGVAWSYVK